MFVPCIDPDSALSEADHSKNQKGNENKSDLSRTNLLSAMDVSLLAIDRLLRRRIRYAAAYRTGKRDGVGVVLFSTKRHQEGYDSNATTHTLLQLEPPGIDQVKRIQKCLPPSLVRPKQPNNLALFATPIKKPKEEELEHQPALETITDIKTSLEAARKIRHGRQMIAETRERDLQSEFEDVDYNSRNPSQVAISLGHSTLCPLRIALQVANKVFRDSSYVKKVTSSSLANKTPRDIKTVWIFTNDDDPCQSNDEEKERVKIIAKDVNDNGVELKLWPLPARKFDRSKFYDSIVEPEESEIDSFVLESFLNRVNQQWKRYRRAFAVPLLLPGQATVEQAMALDMFKLVQPQRKPEPFSIDKRTNQLTVKKSLHLAIESGEQVKKEHIRTFLEFGGERVPFSFEDLLKVKQSCRSLPTSVSQSYLLLLGFQHQGSIPWIYRAFGTRSYLAYPNDDDACGSKAAFTALYTSMIHKQVWGIGELVSSKRAMARFVVIIPKQEVRENFTSNESVVRTRQLESPGFIVSYLPFRDDVRVIPEEYCTVPSPSSVEAAKAMICAQQKDGSGTRSSHPVDWSRDICNPAIKLFWDYMESVALDLPMPKFEDETQMKESQILNAAQYEIDAFKASLPLEEDSKKARSSKRKVSALSEFDPQNPKQIEDMANQGTLGGATGNVLRGYLKSVGQRTTGKKVELVQRIKDYTFFSKTLGEDEK